MHPPGNRKIPDADPPASCTMSACNPPGRFFHVFSRKQRNKIEIHRPRPIQKHRQPRMRIRRIRPQHRRHLRPPRRYPPKRRRRQRRPIRPHQLHRHLRIPRHIPHLRRKIISLPRGHPHPPKPLVRNPDRRHRARNNPHIMRIRLPKWILLSNQNFPLRKARRNLNPPHHRVRKFKPAVLHHLAI